MAKYKISNIAKDDLIRIHQYGASTFGVEQADRYFNAFFDKFQLIAERPNAFESVDFIKKGYRKCVCGVDTIFYRIKDGVIEIMTIIGRQDRLENLHNID
ncbi:MAG: type II toxin-antitoxin system RelE/ParE family toxin [Ekhidna sp.]